MKILLIAPLLSLIMASWFLNAYMIKLADSIDGTYTFGLFGGTVTKTIPISYDCEKLLKNKSDYYIGEGLDVESCEVIGEESILTYKNNSKNTTTIDKMPNIPIRFD